METTAASYSDKNIHVLHCIYTMGIGGAETMLVDIINGQLARGLKVTLLIVNREINESLLSKLDPRVQTIRMNRRPGDKPLLMMLRLNLLVARLSPDIIHVHHHKFCRLIQWRRNRLLMTVHDVNTPMIYCSGSRMVAITSAVEDYVRGIVPSARIQTIYNGIRTADIPARTPGFPNGNIKLVQVARLMAEKKGQDVLIRALGELHRRGTDNVEATFIGTGDDMDMLRELAEAEGVQDRVHFDGLRDRDYIYAHLHEYDAMCHPSRWEGFGLTIAEGMSAGLPLVVSHGDGPWEVADHGRLCLSFPAGDHKACADAIARLIAGWDEAETRAAEAREYVRRFDISRTVDEYIAFYRTLL